MPAIPLRRPRRLKLLVMHVDDWLESQPSCLSYAAPPPREAQRLISSDQNAAVLARQSAAPQWWRWERGEPNPSIPANDQLNELNQNGFPLEPEKMVRAKACDPRRRVTLQRATFHSAALRAHPRSRPSSPCRYPSYGGRAAFQRVSSTQWQKPSVLQKRHDSYAR